MQTDSLYILETPTPPSFPPETDFHIFVRGGINICGGGGGPAACFGRGLVATPGNAKEKV